MSKLNPHRLHRGLASAVVLLPVLLSLLGCGQQSVSLEQAKQTTAQFSGTSMAVPPRTIDDLLAKLDGAPVANDKIAKLRSQAGAAPPAGGGAQDLADFYYDRAIAERDLGLSGRAVQDFRAAYDWARKGYGENVVGVSGRGYAGALAWAEYDYGDPGRSLEIFTHMYNSANEPWQKVVAAAALAQIESWRGNFSAAQDYMDKHDEYYLQYQKHDPWEAVTQANMRAANNQYLGKFSEAEGFWQTSIDGMNAITINRDANLWVYSDYASTLRMQGDLLRAEAVAREGMIAALDEEGPSSNDASYVATALADILADEGRLNEASRVLEKVIEVFRKGGATEDAEMVQNAEMSLAEILAARGEWRRAREIFDRLAGASEAGWIARQLEQSSYPIVLMRTGAADEALGHARKSYETAKSGLGSNNYVTAQAGAILAMALAAKGKSEDALSLFRQSVPIITNRSRQMIGVGSSAGLQGRRLDRILESYLGLLAKKAALGDKQAVSEAFSIADYARGRGLQGAIEASAARATIGDLELADLARQEQDDRQRIAVLSGLLANVAASGGSASDSLLNEIDRLRGARAALMGEIERRFPDYATLIDPRPASLADVQSALHANETLVAYFLGEDASYVWAVRPGRPVGFGLIPHTAAEIGDDVGNLRKALAPDAQTLGDIPAFDVGRANELYQWLLLPVAQTWQGADTLVVVPHRELAQLPFGLLVEKASSIEQNAMPLFSGYSKIAWLIRDQAIAMVPSASSFIALRKLPPGPATRMALAAFGNPAFSAEQLAAADAVSTSAIPAAGSGSLAVRGAPIKLRAAPKTEQMNSAQLAMLPALPETADEVRAIAIALKADPATSVFTGIDANVQRVKTMNLSDRRVVVFATHGLQAGDLDGLTEPALALSSPAVSHTSDNGLLTMGDILGLRLDADWVVLSACNTASGEGGGAEAVSGLGRAFFYAGTRAVLVSNWPVETVSARMLTTDLFHRQSADSTLDRAQALRQSMLGLIDGKGFTDDSGAAVFVYAHPIFWAPFTLIGDSGH